MIAGTLEIQMLANLARLADDMNKAKGMVGNTMRGIEGAVAGAKAALGALGIGLGAIGLVRLVKGALESQDALAKLSQKLNISVEELVGWQHAAQLAGVSNEAFTKGVKSLSSQMFDAASGLLESKRNFATLGIEVQNVDGTLRSTDAVMLGVADKFAAMDDGATKSALAVKLFGKAGLDMIPMLNEGSAAIATMIAEGQRLNPVTSESAHQAEVFNDSMTRLSKSMSAIGIRLLNNVLPVLSEMAKLFAEDSMSGDIDRTQAGVERLNDSLSPLGEVLKVIVILGGNVIYVLKQTGNEIVGITAQIVAAWQAYFSAMRADFPGAVAEIKRAFGAGGIGDLMKEDAEKARAQLDAWEQTILRFGTQSQGAAQRKQATFKPKITGGDEAEMKRFTSALQGLEKQYFSLTNAGQVSLVMYETMKGSLRELTPAHKDELIALAKKIDLYHGMLAVNAAMVDGLKEYLAAEEQANAAQAGFNETNSKALQDGQFQISLIGRTKEEIEKLTLARNLDLAAEEEQSRLNAELFPEQFRLISEEAERTKQLMLDLIDARRAAERSWSTGTRNAFNDYVDHATNAAEQSEMLWSNAFRNMEDAGVKFVRTLKLDFRSLADSIINDLIRIEIRRGLAGLAGPSGGLGSLFLALAGSGAESSAINSAATQGAGSFGVGPIEGFAAGTDYVPRTGLAVVHQGERIIPAAENIPGALNKGGSINVNMTVVTNDAGSFRRSRGQILGDIRGALSAARREN